MADKRRGRPPKHPSERRSDAMAFRCRPGLREQLAEAAATNGGSIAEEIERRVIASFAEDRMRVIAREEAVKVVADSKTVPLGSWNVLPAGQQLPGQETMIGRVTDTRFNQCQAPAEAMRQRYELNGKQ